VNPALPDLFEAVISAPRIVIPTFARAVALLSRKPEGDIMCEAAEFDAAALRAELEHAWPARLAARPDGRRMQYGARIWTAASLLLAMHAQGLRAGHPEVSARVVAFRALCLDALADLGELRGWLWPTLVAACAAQRDEREVFAELLAVAGGVVQRDNALVAVNVSFESRTRTRTRTSV
jgi:hypothetical protein